MKLETVSRQLRSLWRLDLEVNRRVEVKVLCACVLRACQRQVLPQKGLVQPIQPLVVLRYPVDLSSKIFNPVDAYLCLVQDQTTTGSWDLDMMSTGLIWLYGILSSPITLCMKLHSNQFEENGPKINRMILLFESASAKIDP